MASPISILLTAVPCGEPSKLFQYRDSQHSGSLLFLCACPEVGTMGLVFLLCCIKYIAFTSMFMLPINNSSSDTGKGQRQCGRHIPSNEG